MLFESRYQIDIKSLFVWLTHGDFLVKIVSGYLDMIGKKERDIHVLQIFINAI